MVRELAAECALDNGFLESADRRLELLVRDRSLPDKLVENLGRDRRRSFRRLAFRFAVHRHSSCYAPHTKFLTPSGTQALTREKVPTVAIDERERIGTSFTCGGVLNRLRDALKSLVTDRMSVVVIYAF